MIVTEQFVNESSTRGRVWLAHNENKYLVAYAAL